MTRAPLVKICGLTRREDVLAAIRSGADYLGVVLSSGFGRSVEPAAAADLFEDVEVPRVAVLVNESIDASLAAGRSIDATVLQLHGDESVEVVRELRRVGGYRLWKAVRARSVADVAEAVSRYGAWVDGFLVEGWREGAIGGAGLKLRVDGAEVHRTVGDETDFVLAGGLTPETVAAAVARFRPDVVDVSSGVEKEVGSKDHDLVSAFVRNARSNTEAVPAADNTESR